MAPLFFCVFFPPRYLWKEPNPVCHSVHNALPGLAVVLHLAIQHMHEGKSPVVSGLSVLNAGSSGTFSNHLLSTQMIYIACAYATVYLIYMKFRATYDGNHDSFRVEFLVVPVGGLSVLINHDFSFLEVGSESCVIFICNYFCLFFILFYIYTDP